MKGGKTINKDNDNFNGPFGETTSYIKLSLSEIKKLMNKYSNLNCALCNLVIMQIISFQLLDIRRQI